MISKEYRRSLVSLAVAASSLGTLAWSPASLACAVEPYMASICIMAWPKTANFGGSLYMIAAGQTLQVSEYQALYSLIGNTYGGTSPTTFALPDLRGRVIVGVGAGPGIPAVNYGAKGGAAAVTITMDQMPNHDHTLSSNAKVTTTMTGLSATTTLGTLAVNTTAGNLAVNTTAGTLAANSSISGLTATLNASTGLSATAGQDPTGAALPTMSSPARLYTTTTPPTIAMAAGSVTLGGNVTTTLTGAPTSTLTGSPTSTLTGAPVTTVSGNPTSTISGLTDSTGNNDATPTMPPYTALVYYIATGGIYPTPD